jgi:hypothetical protein
MEYGWISLFVYYESIKRGLKRRLIYEYRCDERLKTKNEESTRIQIGMFRPIRVDHTNCLQVDIKTHSFILGDTGLVVELEHLKTKTRFCFLLINKARAKDKTYI